MQSNLGTLDKSIRITLALTALAIYLIKIIEGKANFIFLAITVILFITAFTNYCPIYTIWNFSTKEHQDE